MSTSAASCLLPCININHEVVLAFKFFFKEKKREINCNAQLISLRIMPWLSFLLCHWDIWSRWIPRVSLHYLWQIFSIGLVTEWSICFLCRCQLHLDHCKDTIYLILFFILPIVSDNSVFCAHQTAGHWPNWWRLPPSYCFSFRDFPWFNNQELCSALLLPSRE